MADKKYRDLFNFFKDGGEKTVGTTLRGDMYRQNVWTFGRNPDCDFVAVFNQLKFLTGATHISHNFLHKYLS